MNKVIKIVFSGIQPSGNMHIGNYLGAIKHWVKSQEDGLNIFCIVDLHAITVEQDPKILKEKTLELAGLLIAAGIDPEKSILFIQSNNPDHANLAWILNCNTAMGQLNRMTQYKEKSDKKDFVSVGLFDYPVLMAADILLYQATQVPVGDDQKQHVELARDIAERFNTRFGDTFTIPKPIIPTEAGRVMSLTDPSKKMSKSDPQAASRVNLLDDPKLITRKILKAVTDSSIKFNPKAPGVVNLVEIYSGFTGKSTASINSKFANSNYGDFKKEVANIVVIELTELQKKYSQLRKSGKLEKILAAGSKKANLLSAPTLSETYDKLGFVKT